MSCKKVKCFYDVIFYVLDSCLALLLLHKGSCEHLTGMQLKLFFLKRIKRFCSLNFALL